MASDAGSAAEKGMRVLAALAPAFKSWTQSIDAHASTVNKCKSAMPKEKSHYTIDSAKKIDIAEECRGPLDDAYGKASKGQSEVVKHAVDAIVTELKNVLGDMPSCGTCKTGSAKL